MFTIRVGKAEFEALATEIIENGNTLRFRASGSSMTPFICNGDILEVQSIGAQPIRRGDIVLCQTSDRRMVAHRVMRLAQRAGRLALVTQGDALLYADGWIVPEQVLGRVVNVERGGQRIPISIGWRRWLASFWILLAPSIKMVYRGLRALYRRFKQVYNGG